MEHIMDQRYKIGMLVADMGVIVGAIQPSFYSLNSQNVKGIEDTVWSIGFPDWKTKPVYYVKYMQPQKVLSRVEFEEMSPQIKEDFLDWEYEKVSSRSTLAIPEDGISSASDEEHERFEEILDNL